MSRNYKGKGKQPYAKGNKQPKSKDLSKIKEVKESSASNDPSWYAKSKQILDDTASLSFYTPLGNELDLGYTDRYGGYYSSSGVPMDKLPGILSLNMHILPGIATRSGDPINIAANLLFSATRAKNSGSWTYTVPTLMQYIMAMDSLLATYSDLKRLYGVLNLYSPYNKYAPRGIVNAMGYDFDDFQEHIVDLRAFLNQMCNAVNSRFVPAGLDIITRHSQLFSHVYSDSDSAKAQLYIFRRANYYTWDEQSEPAVLRNNNKSASDLLTFDEAVAEFEAQLDAILASQDFSVISGDLEKAYDQRQGVTAVEDFYQVMPTPDLTILNQIHNAILLPALENADISENINTNSLVYNPTFTSSSAGWVCNYILDMISNDTSPEMVIDSTRLMPVIKQEYSGSDERNVHCTFQSTGSDVVCGASMWVLGPTDNPRMFPIVSNYAIQGGDYTLAVNNLMFMTAFSKFRYHPRVTFWMNSSSTTGYDPTKWKVVGQQFEVNMATIITPDVLSRMHQGALLSQYGVVSN